MTCYELTPDKEDALWFCSKNYEPIVAELPKLIERFPTYFHYTITAYGKHIEPGMPSISKSMETLKKLRLFAGVKLKSF